MVSSINSSSSLMSSIMSKISASQQSGASKTTFSKTDTDGNGKISVEELSVASSQSVGGSSASEFIAAADTDGDSELTPEELLGYLAQMTASGLSGQNNAQLASSRNDDEDDIFTSSDADKDGAVSYEEFVASSGVSGDQAKQIFTDIDTNGDGALSEEEVLAFQENMQASTAATSEDELSKLLLELIQSSKASSAEKAESTEDDSTVTANSTSTTSTTSTYESEEDEIFSYFDKDGDGFVSDTELDEGIQSLQTAMQNYMISMQEKRAAL